MSTPKLSSFPLFIVDAFTTEPFRGNPAAVVVLPKPDHLVQAVSSTTWALSDAQMLQIAREMNLSETVFLMPMVETAKAALVAPGTRAPSEEHMPSSAFGIRWFTPQTEVGLCGHATLAASHVLFSEFTSLLPAVNDDTLPTIRFFNPQAGWLSVANYGSTTNSADTAAPPLYGLDFPLRTPQRFTGFDLAPPQCLEAVCSALHLSTSDVKDVQLHRGARKYLLVLRSPDAVTQKAQLDVERLKNAFADFKSFGSTLPDYVDPLSVTITADARALNLPFPIPSAAGAGSSAAVEVVSRHFAPWVGIDEDPVTGAAHVVLVPYWIREKYVLGDTAADIEELDKAMVGKSLRCMQASTRGGYLNCVVEEGSRLRLQGSAVTFLRGNASVAL